MTNALVIYRGTRVVLSIKIKHEDGRAFDLTDYTTTLVMKDSASTPDGEAALTKDVTVSEPLTGEGVSVLTTENTTSMEDNGRYFYKVKIDNGEGDVQFPIISKVVFLDA